MKRGNFFVVLFFAFLIVAAIFSIVSLQSKINDMKAEYKELEGLVTEYQDKIDGLKYELEQEFDDYYVNRVARERFGYYAIGEKIYIPGDGGKYGK